MARAKKEPAPQEPVRFLEISKGKKYYRLAAWRYYSILDTLRSMGVELRIAEDTAKWSARSKEPGEMQLGDVKVRLYDKEGETT